MRQLLDSVLRLLGYWRIGPIVRGKNYSRALPMLPDNPRGLFAFDFPVSGELDAVTRKIARPKVFRVRYRITAEPGTVFIAPEEPHLPATVSLYLQRKGDNWSGTGRYQSYRWYAPIEWVQALEPGEHEMIVPLVGWSDVQGQIDPQAFAAAILDVRDAGFAFGTASRRSHGVRATGPARFELLSFAVE